MRKSTERVTVTAQSAFEAGVLYAMLYICVLMFFHNLFMGRLPWFWVGTVATAALCAYFTNSVRRYETLPSIGGVRIRYRLTTKYAKTQSPEQYGTFDELVKTSLRQALFEWVIYMMCIVLAVWLLNSMLMMFGVAPF